MTMVKRRQPRAGRLGLTLIELVVGVGVGALVLLMSVAFAHQEIAMLDISQDSLAMTQSGRISLDMLADDLANAGVSVGYSEAGEFLGLEVGTWGAGAFNSNNRDLVNLETGPNIPTDDIKIRSAAGEHVTIVSWSPPGSGVICGPSGFQQDDNVVLRSADGISAKALTLISAPAATACPTNVTCASGCESFAGNANAALSTMFPAGVNENYEGGFIGGGFREVTWFVEDTDPAFPGVGRLRRAEGPCAAANNACGDVVADNVEAMQMRVYTFDGNTWIDQTGSGTRIASGDRIRVDVELALRARSPEKLAMYEPAQLMLWSPIPGTPYCLPGGSGCGGDPKDNVRRMVMRTSVELRNGGRMRIKRGDE